MGNKVEFDVIKSSGIQVKFSLDKLRNSLKHSGADYVIIEEIVGKVGGEIYNGITTNEIYNRAFALLKNKKSVFASRYKLKKAIYELGLTGFPFGRFVSTLLKYSDYSTKCDEIMEGICITHEIDVVANKNGETTIIECKFYSEEGFKCPVETPLYIHSRFKDVQTLWNKKSKNSKLNKGWVVTNTRFTEHAIEYGKCAELYLLSWDYPHKNGLKDRIDKLGLYPVTTSTLLTNREKQFLLSRDIVLYRQLWKDKFFLDHLGISTSRKERILDDVNQLCSMKQ
ncbi:restriction endonuclease [Maribacter confluentis]|uniref:Restriction endonuclease n=1 Tax=Maribacter confluentis TaxID=1656093 RepID=A0ABT8RSN5_9FLAO|nr:restriction endonuclease [Maribacter confluentis]MDO1513870.1 restriction endonuclease [Maribacter confluentis]